jgi:large subunit ribosomal protein L17
MRHRVKGKKLDRSRSSRKALVKVMIKGIIEHGKIETTITKAKYIKPLFEKMITRAKVDSIANRRLLVSRLGDQDLVKKLVEEIAPGFKNRNGGYTRLIRTNLRKGDMSQMVELSLVESEKDEKEEEKATSPDKSKSKKAVKKVEKKDETDNSN